MSSKSSDKCPFQGTEKEKQRNTEERPCEYRGRQTPDTGKSEWTIPGCWRELACALSWDFLGLQKCKRTGTRRRTWSKLLSAQAWVQVLRIHVGSHMAAITAELGKTREDWRSCLAGRQPSWSSELQIRWDTLSQKKEEGRGSNWRNCISLSTSELYKWPQDWADRCT